MKALITVFVIAMFSLSASAAFQAKEPEFAALALSIAEKVYEANWKTGTKHVFNILSEKVKNDQVHVTGTYVVRVFTNESESDLTDAGVDIKVRVVDGAVLEIKVNCRMCS